MTDQWEMEPKDRQSPDNVFPCTSGLRGNLKVHAEDKPLACDICNRRFKKMGTLKQHLMMHIQLKLHQCDICYKYFSQKVGLQSHKLCHTGEKPFRCGPRRKKTCLRGFRKSEFQTSLLSYRD